MRSFENGRKMGGQTFVFCYREKGGKSKNIWKEVSEKGPNLVIFNTILMIFCKINTIIILYPKNWHLWVQTFLREAKAY